jgi:hypothetical protein
MWTYICTSSDILVVIWEPPPPFIRHSPPPLPFQHFCPTLLFPGRRRRLKVPVVNLQEKFRAAHLAAEKLHLSHEAQMGVPLSHPQNHLPCIDVHTHLRQVSQF